MELAKKQRIKSRILDICRYEGDITFEDRADGIAVNLDSSAIGITAAGQIYDLAREELRPCIITIQPNTRKLQILL